MLTACFTLNVLLTKCGPAKKTVMMLRERAFAQDGEIRIHMTLALATVLACQWWELENSRRITDYCV